LPPDISRGRAREGRPLVLRLQPEEEKEIAPCAGIVKSRIIDGSADRFVAAMPQAIRDRSLTSYSR
jgi:hypothetical protein